MFYNCYFVFEWFETFSSFSTQKVILHLSILLKQNNAYRLK